MKKILVAIGIVVLFVGVSVVSSMNSDVEIVSKASKENTLGVNDGLVSYWSFDEISGIIAPDESGNGNDGEIYGATETEGISGLAMDFDGVNDEILVSDDPSLNFHDTNQFSLSIWIRRYGSLVSGSEGLISKCTGSPTNAGYRLFVSVEDTVCFEILDGSTGHYLFSNVGIDKVDWHHIVAIWDGTTQYLYIDGELDNSENIGAVTIADDHKSIQIGNHWMDHWLHGVADEIRIYDRVLDEEEIQELFTNPAGLKTTIMIGRIDNLNTEVGNLMIFEAEKLRCIQFSPFQFIQYSSGEKIKISEKYLGIVTPNFAFGLFKANI